MSTSEAGLYAGVDVGAGRLNVALVMVRSSGDRCSYVSGAGAVTCGSVADIADVVDLCRPVVRVAVDAPGGPSAGAHRDDLTVAPKFRSGRCSEIPLRGVPAVPWVTPPTVGAAAGWMQTGFELWAALAAAGPEVVETFPAALFHRLHGRRWPPPKTTAAGRSVRLSLLSSLVDLPSRESPAWSHDDIDAVACAVVAALGRPSPHVCERPDGSVMWAIG